ncbi:unnamed protein product [Dovyalis caffra]|uniref:Chlorophyll a-b binding protein, chloroplastic n=2 Tax=Magnoliopsida TaxID=3398 RepID=A0AAV1RKC5_9ROSI|nr:unnamed protein product [Dovyalis caffra]
MNDTLQRYRQCCYSAKDSGPLEDGPQTLYQEVSRLRAKCETLERCQRNFLGEDLEPLTVKELEKIEKQLEKTLSQARQKKIEVMVDRIEELRKKEQDLAEENEQLKIKLEEVQCLPAIQVARDPSKAGGNKQTRLHHSKSIYVEPQPILLMDRHHQFVSQGQGVDARINIPGKNNPTLDNQCLEHYKSALDVSLILAEDMGNLQESLLLLGDDYFEIFCVDITLYGFHTILQSKCSLATEQNRVFEGVSVVQTPSDEKRLREALPFANACGSVAVTERGAIPALPKKDAVLETPRESLSKMKSIIDIKSILRMKLAAGPKKAGWCDIVAISALALEAATKVAKEEEEIKQKLCELRRLKSAGEGSSLNEDQLQSLVVTYLCGAEREGKGKAGEMAVQALVSSSLTSSVETARQILGARPTQSPFVSTRKSSSFVVRAASTPPVKQGADRQLWFASKQSLSYLDGSLPGDYGFDPLGLSDPEGTGGFIEPRWLAYGEVINGRYAMLGAVGAIAPEILGKAGLIPPETALPWFKTGVIPPAGTYNYWADPYTLFVFEMALMGFAEHRRFQDWANPGSMGRQYFLGLEKYLGGSGDPAYPGGPLFNPLGFGKDEKSLKDLKLKEVKNGRLAMLAILGYFIQGLVTGVGPFQNLLDHLADPVNNNVLTSLKFH